MEYKIEHEGVIISLPAYSFDIDDRIAEVTKSISKAGTTVRKATEVMYNFILKLLDDGTEDLIGTRDACDPNEVRIVYMKIIDAYAAPVNDYQSKSLNGKIDIDGLSKLIELAEKAELLDKKSKA